MGTPFRRCLRVLDGARDSCKRAIPFLFILCYLVDTVKPFCGLANRAWVPAPLRCPGGGVAGPTPAHRGGPTLAEFPSLHSGPPLLHRPGVHPVLHQESNRAP